MSAGRASARQRTRTTRVGAVLAGVVAIALALATLATPPPAAASRPTGGTRGSPARVAQPPPPGAEPSPRPPRPPEVPAQPRIELVEQSTWHTPGDQFRVQVRITGEPADATARLVVHDRLVSRGAFHRTLVGQTGRTLDNGQRRPVAELPRMPDGTVTLQVPVGAAGVRLPDPGLYPVTVLLESADGEELDSFVTHLVRVPNPDVYPPLSVAVLLDVSSPPTLQADGRHVVSAATLERADERAAIAEATTGLPLTLAPRPETLDGLAAHAERGAAIVDRIGGTARSNVLARPYTEIDLSALAEAGLLREANDQAEMGADVIRGRFGVEPRGGIWLADLPDADGRGGTLGTTAAELLVELGVPRAVVPPTAVRDGELDGQIPQVPVVLGRRGPKVMVSDPQIGDRIVSGGALGAQHAVSELAMVWFERPAIPRGVVVHVPPEAPIDDPAAVARAVQTLDETHAVDLVPLEDLFRLPPGDEGPRVVDAAPHEAGTSLVPIARQVLEARARIAGYGRTVGDDDAGRSLEQSLLVALGATTPGDQRADHVNRVSGLLGSLAESINAPDEFRITLTSRSSTIPLNITNSSDQPVDVRIRLRSTRLEFPDGDVITTTLTPGATRLDVRVETRTSGAFPLDITITSPDGSMVLDETTFDIRSTTVSGVGLLLSIGAGAFLVVWWVRNWRSSRRSTEGAPAGPSEGVSGGAPSGDGHDGSDREPPVHAASSDAPPGPPVGAAHQSESDPQVH